MNTLPFSTDASLKELLEQVGKKYKTTFETVKVGQHQIELLQIEDMASYVDRLAETTGQDEKLELPFWAKIWPTSILLGYFVQRIDPKLLPDMLEIGTGVGVCGLIAAKHGFNVTISDIVDDALLFSRINVLKNGLEKNCRVARIDFTSDRLDKRFDTIIGSEVLYVEDSYRQMVKFLLNHLNRKPGAEVVIAKDYRLKAKKFFALAEKEFHIQEKVIGYKASDDEQSNACREKQLSAIYRLQPRKQ